MTLFICAVNLMLVLGIATCFRRWADLQLKPLFWPGFLFKILAGLCLGLVYRNYYSTGDTFYLFEMADQQALLFFQHPMDYFTFLWRDADVEWKGAARSAFFVKFASVFAILTNGNYWLTSVWLSLLSFAGSFFLVNNIVREFRGATLAAAMAFLFFPSVVFWGSGVIKESVGLGALLLLSGIFLRAMMNRRPGLVEYFFALLSIWIVWNLKYYWIAVFIPVAATSVIVHYASLNFRISYRAELSYWVILFAVLCFGASLSHPNFYPERFLQVVYDNHQAFVAASDPVDLIHYDSLRPTWGSIFQNSPWAIFSGLFRPFLWEADSFLKVVVATENVLILVLMTLALTKAGVFFQTQNRLITLSLIVYIALLCCFLSLSTPNLGSLARYKVGFLPFLIFLIIYKNPGVAFLFSKTRLRGLKKWLNLSDGD